MIHDTAPPALLTQEVSIEYNTKIRLWYSEFQTADAQYYCKYFLYHFW